MQEKELIFKILQCRPIAYLPDLAKALGSVKAGLFLSQLLYWMDKGADEDGWLYKTREELYDETGLSRREQETARATLKKLGILEEGYRGLPRRLYFKINVDKLLEILAGFYEQNQRRNQQEGDFSANKEASFVPTSRPESRQQEGEFCANKEATFVPAITEITTENTTENNKETLPTYVGRGEDGQAILSKTPPTHPVDVVVPANGKGTSPIGGEKKKEEPPTPPISPPPPAEVATDAEPDPKMATHPRDSENVFADLDLRLRNLSPSTVEGWKDVVAWILEQGYTWTAEDNGLIEEVVSLTYLSPRRVLSSIKSPKAQEYISRYGPQSWIQTFIFRPARKAIEEGRRETPALGGFKIKGKEASAQLTPARVIELYNSIARSCEEFKPIEAATQSLKARIKELMKTDAKFRDLSFWEKLIKRGRDYVIWANRKAENPTPRTLSWLLKDSILEMILTDAKGSWEQAYTLITGDTMRRFREFCEEEGYDWELVKQELLLYISGAKKTEEGIMLRFSTPGVGEKVARAIEAGNFPHVLELLALRKEVEV